MVSTVKQHASVVQSPESILKTAVSGPLSNLDKSQAAPISWTPRCHSRAEEFTDEVNRYFLGHWNFSSEHARNRFLAAGFPRVTCLYFPLALDEHIHLASRLLTVLALIDDLLEESSLTEGEAYNSRLMSISRGDIQPSRSIAAEAILCDLWSSMREHDEELPDDALEPTFSFMRVQTDKTRLSIHSQDPYLKYREIDVGQALLSALMRFSMGIRLSCKELDEMHGLERNCARHLSMVNHIFISEKELRASEVGHKEGSYLCSAVKIVAAETDLGIPATKRVLWSMVREWEKEHESLVACKLSAPQGSTEVDRLYMKGLE